MFTKDELTIERVNPDDIELIELIANWYYQEWKIPTEKTIQRISKFKKKEFPFHIIVKKEGQPIATGGLYTDDGMGLPTLMPDYRNRYEPWVALLYTIPKVRGKGLGAILTSIVEEMGVELGYTTQYLYTFTAEPLYIRQGWEVIERLTYNGHENTVLMRKIFTK